MKEFDFDDIGKKTPYHTPDNFFEDMQQKVMKQTCGVQRRPKGRLQIILSTAIASAAILAGVLFISPYFHTGDVPGATSNILAIEKNGSIVDPADKWINELSDEELEELVNFSENDIFLN